MGLKIWTSYGVPQKFSKSPFWDDYFCVFGKLKGISCIILSQELQIKCFFSSPPPRGPGACRQLGFSQKFFKQLSYIRVFFVNMPIYSLARREFENPREY